MGVERVIGERQTVKKLKESHEDRLNDKYSPELSRMISKMIQFFHSLTLGALKRKISPYYQSPGNYIFQLLRLCKF
jgi:hypothetical protein